MRVLFRLFRPRKLIRKVIAIGFICYVINGFFSACGTTSTTTVTAPPIELPTGYKYTSSYSETASSTEKAISENQSQIFISIPEYTGQSSVDINDGVPYFTEKDIVTDPGEVYGETDKLGRCTSAKACLSKATMPVYGETRGEIGMIKPSGWHTVKYDCIEDRYLYNRCHLIGWQLGAENDNEKNLITGTRYMNLEMTASENLVANYIRKTGNRVMYRVTPIFKDDELVCRGLLIEAKSLDDDKISFCKFYFNVQPGIEINYSTGESSYSGIFLDKTGQSVVTE